MREMKKSSWALLALIAILLPGCMHKDNYDTYAQLQADIETIDNYLAVNGINAYNDPSGVRFHITELGTKGFPVRLYQQVRVSYKGTFMNGTVFDSKDDITFPIAGVILGWQYVIPILPIGTKATLYIPSPLGYGNKPANATIPPNSILIFDVEIKENVLSNADKARFNSDVTLIQGKLEDKNITAVKDTTGIFYVIHDEGSGPAPTLYQQVSFSYKGTNISNGLQFVDGGSAPSDVFASRVCDFNPGLQFALQHISQGGKITVYVPSLLGLGPADDPTTNLPANSNVSYDVTLEKITF